jgi:hypothetical protein
MWLIFIKIQQNLTKSNQINDFKSANKIVILHDYLIEFSIDKIEWTYNFLNNDTE